MKRLFLICFILTISNLSYSQEKPVYGNQISLNSIYGSIGFNPEEFYIPLTVSYERLLYDTGFLKLNARTGFSFWVWWTEKGFDVPITTQVIFFKKTSHIDIGIGGQLIYDFNNNMTGLSHLLNIAYRFQKAEGGFIFRVGMEKNKFLAYPLLSFGYAF